MHRFRVVLQHPKVRWLVLCTAITTLTWLLAGCAGNPSLSAASTGFAPFILVVWLFVLSTVGLLTGCGGDNSASFPPNTFTGTTGSATTSSSSTTTTTGSNQQVPVKLAFVVPPSAPSGGIQALTTIPNFQVAIEDASGNVVTTDNAPITISIVSGPPHAAITGTATVNAVNGVATFSGLQLTLAGAYTIQATSPGLQSVSVTFAANPLPLAFKGHRDLPTLNTFGSSIAMADLDGDGNQDIIVSGGYSAPYSSQISVFFGNADGTFAPAVQVPTGIPQTGQIVTARFNGDSSLPDIFVAPDYVSKASKSGFTVIVPTSSRTFSATTPQALGTFGSDFAVTGVVTGNFEGDGTSVDVALTASHYQQVYPSTNFNSTSGSLVVLHGTGSSTTLNKSFQTPFSGAATALAIGDFNGDQKLDIAVANPGSYSNSTSTSNYIKLFLGNGSSNLSAGAATFKNPVSLSTGKARPMAIASARFNGDEISDLVVGGAYQSGNGDSDQGFVGILTGKSVTPYLTEGTLTMLPAPPNSIAAPTLTSGGPADVVAQLQYLDEIAVLLGNGSGGLGNPTFYADGDTDDQNNSQKIKVGNTFALGSFGGDKNVDIAVLNYGGHSASSGGRNVNLFIGNGDGTLLAPSQIVRTRGSQYPITPALADLNGDGKPDLIWAEYDEKAGGVIYVALGNGDGSFGTPQSFTTGLGGTKESQILVGDFNGDGKPDVAFAYLDTPGQGVEVLPGNGDGTLGAALTPVSTGITKAPTFRVAAADLNGDGILDLAFGSAGNTYVALGKGDGTFGTPTNVGAASGYDIAIADVNGDGVPDILTVFDGNVYTLLGNVSSQVWTAPGGPQTTVVPGGNLLSLAIGDFNGDGHPDVAATGYPSSSSSFDQTTILGGNGDGTFKVAGSVNFVDTFPSQTLAVDMNADGILDLVVVNNESNDVSILLGNGDGTFAPQQMFGLGDGAATNRMTVGDITGSGKIDIVSADSETGALSILLHD